MFEIKNLSITFDVDGSGICVLEDLNYSLGKAQVLAVVGESGSGKTVHALSLMKLLPPGAKAAGEVLLEGQNVFAMDKEALRKLRGGKIAMVFQDPMTSLNPVFTVKNQITEAILAHTKIPKQEAVEKAKKILKEVGIEEKFLDVYPHQLSGGMRQRVMIAIALCCGPKILIADEPTTALDVTVQAQILELIKKLQKEHEMTVIFITHNLAIVDDVADRVIVLYGGQKVEEAAKEDLFKNPLHPYTKGLLASIVTLGDKQEKLNAIAGAPPMPGEVFKGCNFEPRCPFKMKKCKTQKPPLFEAGHSKVRCWLHGGRDE